MARWADIEDTAPEFAESVRVLFDSRRHKVLATLRKDGSPRLSGIEVTFADGEVWIGLMPDSRKGADLARDPRLSIQISSADPPPEDPSGWAGDATLSGSAELVDDPERLKSMASGGEAEREAAGETGEPSAYGGEAEREAAGETGEPSAYGADADEAQNGGGAVYRIEISEAVLTRVAPTNDHMIIESWNPSRGYRSTARY